MDSILHQCSPVRMLRASAPDSLSETVAMALHCWLRENLPLGVNSLFPPRLAHTLFFEEQ